MATVYLKSKSGRSFLKEGRFVPSDPKPYLPSGEIIEKAISGLQQLGFTIEAQGVTLSISGSPALFEKTFGVKISIEKKIVSQPNRPMPATQFIYTSSQPVMRLQQMDDIIEGVVIAVPGVPFESQ